MKKLLATLFLLITALVFAQYVPSGGGGTTYSAGTCMGLSGTTFNFDVTCSPTITGTWIFNGHVLSGDTGAQFPYFQTATASPASAGVVRLAKTDLVEWRNNAGGGNNTLGTSSDNLQYNAANVAMTGGDINSSSQVTGLTHAGNYVANVASGAGLSGGSSGSNGASLTLTTDSTQQNFLASGALICGAGTNGKAKVHTTPLQYCDNAATPALQYAAYGNSAGAATGLAAGTYANTYTFPSISNAYTGTYTDGSADPADSGSVRLGNGNSVCWEESPAGTDACVNYGSSIYDFTIGGIHGLKIHNWGPEVTSNGNIVWNGGTALNSSNNQTNGQLQFGNANGTAQSSFTTNLKTLTESSATSIFSIAVASGTVTGGMIVSTIRADDGTNFQALTERVVFAATNKAGTVHCTLGTVDSVNDNTSGTLTDTITCVASGNNVLIQQNAVSSLTQTTLQSKAMLTIDDANIVTNQ